MIEPLSGFITRGIGQARDSLVSGVYITSRSRGCRSLLSRLPMFAGTMLAVLTLLSSSPGLAQDSQQSPQPPMPMPMSVLSGLDPASRANQELCQSRDCPDKEHQVAAGIPGVSGSLCAGELPPTQLVERFWKDRISLKPLPGALLRESRARQSGFFTWRAGFKPDLSAPIVSEQPTEAACGENGLGQGSPDEVIARQKLLMMGSTPLSCGPMWDKLDWRPYPVGPLWSRVITAPRAGLLRVTLSGLQEVDGFLAPDPIAWLLSVPPDGEPGLGEILAVSDDGPDSVLPQLELALREGERVRVLVAAYQPSSAGRCDVAISLDGRDIFRFSGAFFSGVRIPGQVLAAGDRLMALAGKRDGRPGRGDPVLLALRDGTSRGSYAAVGNSLGLFSELVVDPSLAGAATILLASYGEGALDDPVLMRSTSGSDPSTDLDRDGLDQSLEKILGTCDGPEQGCAQGLSLVPGWRPWDSDNDGLSDLEEVFGVRRCYAKAPRPPFYDPGACLDRDEDGHCDRDCLDGDWVVAIPLGPIMDADPLRYDVYVEADGILPLSSDGTVEPVRLPEGRALAQLSAIYSGSRGGPESRAQAGLGMRVHWFNDGALAMPNLDRTPHFPSTSHRHTWFNLLFTPERKYTGVFRYMIGVEGQGGQSDVRGRTGIVGMDSSAIAGIRIAHELGHILGLSHFYDRALPDRVLFYLSIMNYGYLFRQPLPLDWDGEFLSCGKGAPPCREGFVCVKALSANRCVPDCGGRKSVDPATELLPGGFSAGALKFDQAASESDLLPEEGYPRWFLPYLYCYSDERARISHSERTARFLSPLCLGGRCVSCNQDSCSIDLDQDGKVTGAHRYDLDFSGRLEEVSLRDGDDWTRMHRKARAGLSINSFKDTILYAATFEGGSATNSFPMPVHIEDMSGGLWKDLTNRCHEVEKWSHCRDRWGNLAALFRGPASGDRGIHVSFCENQGRGCLKRYQSPSGATVSFRIKVWNPSWDGEPVPVLSFSGYVVSCVISGETGAVEWTLRRRGEAEPLVYLKDPKGMGTWVRLTLTIRGGVVQVPELKLRRGELFLTATGKEQVQTPVDLSELWIGSEYDEASLLTGLMDDIILISDPLKSF